MALRFYEDIEVGEKLVSEPYTVSEQEIIDFAMQFDPRAIHTDAQAGLESEFGGLIASGIHIMALWRKLEFTLTEQTATICGLGSDEMRLELPLYANDTIYVQQQPVAKRRSKSLANRGIVQYESKVFNQDDKVVMLLKNSSLIESKT